MQTMTEKYVFVPMVGARATGKFANIAIKAQPIAAATAVTVTRAALSIPVWDSIAGFTAKMYDIAMNVANPASSSFGTVEPRSPRRKNFSRNFMYAKSVKEAFFKFGSDKNLLSVERAVVYSLQELVCLNVFRGFKVGDSPGDF